MATRDTGGDRPVWAPTRPFELAMAARTTGFADTQPAELAGPARLPKPAEPRPAAPTRPAASQQVAWSTAKAPGFQPTRPAALIQPARPASGVPHTRPAGPRQPGPPAAPRQAPGAAEFWPAPQAVQSVQAATPARAAAPGRAIRPADPAPAAPSAPRRGAVTAAPARPLVTAPSASGHWQLSGKPGEHLVLMPGQMHLGQQAASVRTLLGSCVAITLWHPVRRIGGMCHFLLPQRQRRPGDAPDGRYGDEAVEAMVKTLETLRAEPREFVAHLYGGADTMSGCSAVSFNIGERNIEQGWRLIDRYGFTLDGVDVGEDIPRVVSLALSTGEVSMRRGNGKAPDLLRDDAG